LKESVEKAIEAREGLHVSVTPGSILFSFRFWFRSGLIDFTVSLLVAERKGTTTTTTTTNHTINPDHRCHASPIIRRTPSTPQTPPIPRTASGRSVEDGPGDEDTVDVRLQRLAESMLSLVEEGQEALNSPPEDQDIHFYPENEVLISVLILVLILVLVCLFVCLFVCCLHPLNLIELS
jgi:hypothetical protein